MFSHILVAKIVSMAKNKTPDSTDKSQKSRTSTTETSGELREGFIGKTLLKKFPSKQPKLGNTRPNTDKSPPKKKM